MSNYYIIKNSQATTIAVILKHMLGQILSTLALLITGIGLSIINAFVLRLEYLNHAAVKVIGQSQAAGKTEKRVSPSGRTLQLF